MITYESGNLPSSLTDIQAGLRDLVRVVRERGIESIAIPPLGCGNGGLDWNEVRPLIEDAFAGLPDVRVLVYPPAGAPDPASMPVGDQAPTMTAGRAVLLTTIDRYLSQAHVTEPREGVTELEIQKLTYFLQILEQPLRLTFVRGRYGPYAEALHYVLQAMEGHYLIGYGDRTARVTDLQPIQLTPGTNRLAVEWIDANEPAARDRIDALMRLVEGYETPYSLELLATVHFAADQLPVPDHAELIERVRSWTDRKARLFTIDHINLAVWHLRSTSLLPQLG